MNKKTKQILKEIKERIINLKNLKIKDTVLWFGIGVVTLIISPFIFGWWTILFIVLIIFGRSCNLTVKTFLTIFTVGIAIASLNRQNILLNSQITQFQLDKRPYLFVDFKYKGGLRESDILFGADMVFKNTGKFPAKIIKAEYLVCDEKECHDYKKWYTDTYGGFPEITLVPPNSDVGPFAYAAGLLKGSKYGCVGVLLTYQGFESNKEYWFYRIDKFKIDIAKDSSLRDSHQIGHVIQWDENKDKPKPRLEKPSFTNEQ